MEKISISITEEHARLIAEAIESGDYASSSEIVREALRDWRAKRTVGALWDAGLASGMAETQENIDEIKSAARNKPSR